MLFVDHLGWFTSWANWSPIVEVAHQWYGPHQQKRLNCTTERKWPQLAEWCGANTCPSMWRRQRRLWWTSGETLLTTPHWPSTARLWSESAALNSWGCTSQRPSPGPPTPCQFPRRYNSAYTFSASWKEQVSLHLSSPLSTVEPLRACWPAASLSVREL